MARKKRKKYPRWVYLAWGGFNAGCVLGLLDALLIMTFGLANFDRTGPIVGLIILDAVGMGIIGTLCVLIGFKVTGFLGKVTPKIKSLVSGLLLISVYLLLAYLNIGWVFKIPKEEAPVSKRNILLISLDTLRSDMTGFGGNCYVRTPLLDSLASKGWQFCNAVCPVPMTTPSHASILTGTIPAVHGAKENRYRLNRTNQTMTEIFRQNGYMTAAFVSCFPLDRRFGLDQGFILYNDIFSSVGDLRQASWMQCLLRIKNRNLRERPARHTNSLVLPWIKKYGKLMPFFLWIHYFDPHAPYTPPKHEIEYYQNTPVKTYNYNDDYDYEKARAAVDQEIELTKGLPERLYLGEVSTVDKAVYDVVIACMKADVLSNTDIIIVADHGESFGEHGLFYTHGEDVYEPALSVPLVFWGDDFAKSTIDDRLASLIDIPSTLLPAISLPLGSEMMGVNLKDLNTERKIALVENFGIILALHAKKQRAVRTPDTKFIAYPGENTRELYDLIRDPNESNNIISSDIPTGQYLEDIVENGFKHAEMIAKQADIDESAETREKLKSLGYIVN
ncbi:sulfatase [bacterium]|nr:sulfatase [candidate division CSSED10-310 bacterium]